MNITYESLQILNIYVTANPVLTVLILYKKYGHVIEQLAHICR